MQSSLLLGCLAAVIAVSNAQFSLQCYTCHWSEVLSDNSVFNVFLSAINSLSDRHCLLKEDDDLTEINIRQCAEEKGKVAKCVKIQGTVNSKVNIKITEFDFKFEKLSRSCVLVDENDSEFSDGCHDDPAMNPVIKSLLEEHVNGLDFVDMEFKGTACYSRSARSNAGTVEKQTSGASTRTWSVISALSCLVLLFL